jgi:ubiquinone/menaquinone biosynthesis C-methylase UbiE
MSIDYKNQDELKKYLHKVDRIFNISKFLAQDIDFQDIANYYRDSSFGYSLFHSTSGSIHMALNYDGQFNKDGYFGQAKIIQEYINRTKAKKVLELASGKGFNSTYLAKQNPDVEFIGIDLTPEHVKFANENAQGISNLKFEQGNFQDLQFPDGSFDLVFEVESVCHATDMKKALSESKRVLKPQGLFIVIDGFRSPDFDSFSDDLKTAAKLAEISMAVEKGWKINEWTSLCETVGLKVEKVDDLSMAIMPNLSRFQFLARGFFKFPSISRTILKTMPYYLVQNAIAGIFMPFTIGAGMQKYYMVALTSE